MSKEIEHMTEREMRRSTAGFVAGLILTGAALACGVILGLSVMFTR